MSNELRVTLQVDNNIALVTLNRPEKRNALDMAMFRAIVDVQKQIAKRRDIDVVILTGSGEDFCSGLDVKSVFSNKMDAVKLLWKWWPFNPNLAQKVTLGWQQLSVPVISAVHGRCWGGGLQIAMGADYVIADKQASLSIMEAKWGLIPDMGGTVIFRERMRRDVAQRLAMTAEVLDAQTARDYGLVSEVSDDAMASAQSLATQLADRNPDALRAAKRLYQKSWSGGWSMALFRESWYQWRILLGKNQPIAVKRQQGQDKPYKPAKRW